jgi:pyruvate dehydrogenase E1 component alpha subunit
MAETSAKRSAKKGAEENGTPLKEHYLPWYELMLRIRRFEERTLMMYSQNKIRGFLHVYIGQEAIAAAMTTAIRPDDPVVTAYRQHGIAISRGLDTRNCMAE